MPRIFDNIAQNLLPALRDMLSVADSAAFCVGYLNLRGWDTLADLVDRFAGGSADRCCRLLVGMHRPPEEEMRLVQGLHKGTGSLDGPSLARLRQRITESFKEQLEFGIPTNQAETALRKLAAQLRAGKVRVKAFLRYPLHAKLYLMHRTDPVAPLVAFVGSSNLTQAGLSGQGELNVDVVEQDAAQKLQDWFDQRWDDELAFDISQELAALIESSWAGVEAVRPYLIYLKIAYHLCEEARQGEREFKLPKAFQGVLLDFQTRAVSLAAHYLYRRGGVLLGDVVGLGKTLMATAVAKVFQEDDDSNTLIICPPKLRPMWEQHAQQYRLTARVLSLGAVIEALPDMPRYRLLIIDESQNLRNREGRRYRAIRDYIERNEPRVLLISATPYNKQYADLSNQLRLFVDEDQDLHVRPERFFHWWAAQGKQEVDFLAQFQASPYSLRAFEHSEFPEDWRDLMRLFLVRRTRQFIINNYATFDKDKQRYYVTLNGQPAYFPVRQPITLGFAINPRDPADQYARLFRNETVAVIENLALPRYGLARYLVPNAERLANAEDQRILDNLARAGRRLIGFCRTNLFKRLESSGFSFLLSVERHLLRNLVTLYALEHHLPVPIGTQNAAMLDTLVSDADEEFTEVGEEDGTNDLAIDPVVPASAPDLAAFRRRAAAVYQNYHNQFRKRFDWLDPKFFRPDLNKLLLDDAQALLQLLNRAGEWQPEKDAKLDELCKLLVSTHPRDKVLVFTQFADTALYLVHQLRRRGVTEVEVATNGSEDPVAIARRFSPSTNGGLKPGETELRVLIATDVLAEGQNLQDGHIIVNFDLPWAIIRLIQRAGRVDRIGQKHDTILAYSFLPADGVEQIIRLRQRLFHRLRVNQEVIGTDESFFGEDAANRLRDLYTEKAGVLDDDRADEDIDLASLALQVWNSASPEDQKAARNLPPIVSAAGPLPEGADPLAHPPGLITYLRFPDSTDALVRVNENGNLVSQSLSAIFRATACAPDTPPLARAENHHDLVRRCVEIVMQEQTTFGGQLGSLRSVSRKVYDRLNRYRQVLQSQPTLFAPQLLREIGHVIDLLYRFPLRESARDALGRQIRLGITDEALADLVIRMAADERLCQITEAEQVETPEPRIVCSLGLRAPQPRNQP